MSVLVCGRACLSGMFAAFRRGPRYSRFSGASKASVLSERQNTPELRANNLPAVASAPRDRSHRPPQTGSYVCRQSHPPSQQVIHLPAVTGTQKVPIRTLAWARVWLPAALASASACQMWGQWGTRAVLTRLFLMNSRAGGGGVPEGPQQHHH